MVDAEDAEETAYSRHMVFRGPIDWRKCRQILVHCIAHRQFKLAFKILESMLHKAAFTQETWIWRIVLVVLANTPNVGDHIYRQCFRMLHFTKTSDYDERRMSLYFLLEKLGKSKLARDILEKDMPKRMWAPCMRSMFKGPLAEYEIYSRAQLQMTRAVCGFWKPPVEDDEEDAVFSLLPLGRIQEGDKRLGEDDQNPNGSESGQALLDQLLQPGSKIVEDFSYAEFRRMFRTFVTATENAGYFVLFLIEILERYNDVDYLESVLIEYAAKNPLNPWALSYIIDFYLKYKPDEPELRWPFLKNLAQIDPFGKCVTQYCQDYLQQESPDSPVEMLHIVFRALNQPQQKCNVLCWTALARLLRNFDFDDDSEQQLLSALKEYWLDAYSFWPKYHFRLISQAEKDDSDLLYNKIQVCIGMFGPDHSYVKETVEFLSHKKRLKLEKSQAGLQSCHQRLACSVQYPLFAPKTVSEPTFTMENLDSTDSDDSRPNNKKRRKAAVKKAGKSLPVKAEETIKFDEGMLF
ncbi:uncharacterized protein LOC129585607 [Paramacrobiotus metropolitanus]|uniref:uncharacterized protein LOC129585607 n=1 Tax=Paramacrobiotus metropolitanus TaxID=2943436 RepID=UPI002446206E|nr:uncharacterized protein LOC129585607 [Paramacrobiotus metropolitanus]